MPCSLSTWLAALHGAKPALPPHTPPGALVGKAHSLLALYRELGVAPERLIFRLPATWEGTQAARKLEGEGLATQVGAWRVVWCGAVVAALRACVRACVCVCVCV